MTFSEFSDLIEALKPNALVKSVESPAPEDALMTLVVQPWILNGSDAELRRGIAEIHNLGGTDAADNLNAAIVHADRDLDALVPPRWSQRGNDQERNMRAEYPTDVLAVGVMDEDGFHRCVGGLVDAQSLAAVGFAAGHPVEIALVVKLAFLGHFERLDEQFGAARAKLAEFWLRARHSNARDIGTATESAWIAAYEAVEADLERC